MSLQAAIALIEELEAHLEYTGWGDNWEREVSQPLRDGLEARVQALRNNLTAVPVPTTEDMAAMMVLLGMQYLEQYAPHRIRKPPPQHVKLDCGCATVDGQQVMVCLKHNQEIKPSG